MSSSMRIGGGPRLRPRHAGQVGAAMVFIMALPTNASAHEGERSIGFGLRLRPPSVMFVARRARRARRKPSPRKETASPKTAAPLPAAAPPTPATSGEGSSDLDFDLLGPTQAADQPVVIDEGKVELRRKMLTYHPLLGIGLLVCETATVVVGQLNYNDRFGGGPSSGRYQQTHRVLAWSTAALFVGTGALALLAPNPLGKKHEGFDRVLLHKIAMLTAAAGMVTEIVLGIYTASREGYLNQTSLARTHLAIGYTTLAATYLGVGSIVF